MIGVTREQSTAAPALSRTHTHGERTYVITITDSAVTRLLTTRNQTCPRCGHSAPPYDWKPLDRHPSYRDQLVAVYRCPTCRCIFAPIPDGWTLTRTSR